MPGFIDRFVERQIATNITSLADDDERTSAIHTLKGFGKRAIPSLIAVLGDPSRGVYAAIVLSEMGEPAIPALLDALNDDSKMVYASRALLEMGKKKEKTRPIIIPRLIDALADKNESVRVIAGVTLGEFGAPALEPFVPALEKSLGNVNARVYAAKVLEGIGKPAVVSVPNPVPVESRQRPESPHLQETVREDKTGPDPTPTQQRTMPVPDANQSPKPKFCRHCGAPLATDSVYCSQCGKKVE